MNITILKFRIVLILALIFIMVYIIPTLSTAGNINIPINIQEALPADVSGITRIQDSVTIGVPLEDGTGIRNINQLGINGVTKGQFRELAKWPSGDIKWVLADFQTDVSANSYITVWLINGSGNFGGSNLATDNGDNITVNTGAAQFTIKKANFNFFENVMVNGYPFISTGGEGLILLSGSSTYTSSNDSLSAAVIEENGPVRSVIKSTGRLKNISGAGHLWFTVRLHFYAGKSYVKAHVTLRNATYGEQTLALFDSVEVKIPLMLQNPKSFEFAKKNGIASGNFLGTEPAYLFQAFSPHRWGGDTWRWSDFADPPMTKFGTGYQDYYQKGLEIDYNGSKLNVLGDANDYSQGWAEIKDSTGKGVTSVLRWMSSLWPAGFELDGSGNSSVELYSKRNSKKGIGLSWGSYDTREIMFDFHTQPADNKAVLYRLQYPLIGRVSLDQYRKSGAIYGEKKLVSAQEQINWFASNGHQSPSLDNIRLQLWRFWYWPEGGGDNQMDFALTDLVDYLRTGHGGFYLQGEFNTLFKVDSGIVHSDDFDYTITNFPGHDYPGRGGFNPLPLDWAHNHWISLPIYYYMSGNELVRESLIDYGEERDVEMINRAVAAINGTGDERGWSRAYRDFVLLYEFTGNSKYAIYLTKMTDLLLDTLDDPADRTKWGRNLERGYMYMSHEYYETVGIINDLLTVQIHYEAVYEAKRVLEALTNYERVEDLKDYLIGLGYFIFNEMYFEVGDKTSENNFGYLYRHKLDSANSPGIGGLRPISTGRAMSYLYEYSGDIKYLDRESKLLWGDINYVTERTPSEYKSHAFIYNDIRRLSTGWKYIQGFEVLNQGNGTYTLRWTIPPGAERYQIKYSEKPIIEWLGFDQASRMYQYDPSKYTAFFAAKNISNEPIPGLSGSVQEFTISGLDPNKSWNFAIKYYGSKGLDTIPPNPPQGLKVK